MESKTPSFARTLFTDEDFKRIEQAVAKVEATTEGEIVPMLVRQSVHTGHAFWLILFFLLAVFFAFQVFGLEMQYLPQMAVWAPVDAVVLIVLSLLLSRWPWLALKCVPLHDRFKQVHNRAEIEFFEQHVMSTKNHTGILLFVSLLERRAVVLADETISNKLHAEAWIEVCELLVNGIKEHSLTVGYVRAIEKCQSILQPLFPARADKQNERPDGLIIKD